MRDGEKGEKGVWRCWLVEVLLYVHRNRRFIY